jgi:hypothetical protein
MRAWRLAAITRAARAIVKGDHESKAKHLDEAKYWEVLLKAAGESLEGIAR